MDYQRLAKKLEGLQTISTIMNLLNINRETAINYVYYLRKNGFLETIYQKRKIRMYKIRPYKKPKIGYIGLYEFINKNSKVGVIPRYEHMIYDHKLTAEEAIVRAIKSKRFRLILASLGLFNKIKNWSRIYNYAKKEKIERQIGALYDVARGNIRVKRMDKRIRDKLLKSKIKERYIINGLKSKTFKNIEKLWKVYIPFNKADLEVYKEW